MKDSEHKDISDPTYSAADFRVQLTGGRLRWFASVLAVANGGLLVYFFNHKDKAEIDFPIIITGPAAIWIMAVTFVILVAIAVVNWRNWLRKKKDAA
jgi:hypothetical protein